MRAKRDSACDGVVVFDPCLDTDPACCAEPAAALSCISWSGLRAIPASSSYRLAIVHHRPHHGRPQCQNARAVPATDATVLTESSSIRCRAEENEAGLMKWVTPPPVVIRFHSIDGNGLEYNRSENTSRQLEVGNGSEDQKKADRGSSKQTASQVEVPGRPCSSGRSLGALAQRRIAAQQQHRLPIRCRSAVSMGGVGAEIGAPDCERERERGAKRAALSAAGTRGSGPCLATCRNQMDWA